MKLNYTATLNLLIIISLWCPLKSADPLKMLWEGNPDDFIEMEIITKPRQSSCSIKTSLKKIILSVLAGVSGAIASNVAIKHILSSIGQESLKNNYGWHTQTPKLKLLNYLKTYTPFGAVAIGIVTTVISHIAISSYLEKKIEYTIFEQFIREWPDNKALTPKRFHKSYEALYDLYVKDKTLRKFHQIAPDVLKKTKLMIYKHFANKYHKELGASQQSCDPDNIIKDEFFVVDFKPFFTTFAKFFFKKW